MKVLDLFCGMGGWSVPFIEAGDDVIGIDIVNNGYPGKLVLKDIRKVKGKKYKGFDLIIGSSPCIEFTRLGSLRWTNHGIPQNVLLGCELVGEFFRVIREAKPKFWALENVTELVKWMPYPKPIWSFRITKRGMRSLWGNIPLPNGIMNEYRTNNINQGFSYKPKRAFIPRAIAQIIFDAVKEGSN